MPTRSQLFEGPALEPLLEQIRSEAGPEARIVQADRVRRGGFLGFFAREHFEIIVELDDSSPPAPDSDQRSSWSAMAEETRDTVEISSQVPSTETASFATVLAHVARETGPAPPATSGPPGQPPTSRSVPHEASLNGNGHRSGPSAPTSTPPAAPAPVPTPPPTLLSGATSRQASNPGTLPGPAGTRVDPPGAGARTPPPPTITVPVGSSISFDPTTGGTIITPTSVVQSISASVTTPVTPTVAIPQARRNGHSSDRHDSEPPGTATVDEDSRDPSTQSQEIPGQRALPLFVSPTRIVPAQAEPSAAPVVSVITGALLAVGLPTNLLPANSVLERLETLIDARDGVNDLSVALTRVFEELPSPPNLPTRPGALVAVVGEIRRARRLAELLACELGLDPGEVAVASSSIPRGGIANHLLVRTAEAAAECSPTWRLTPRVTMVAVDAPLAGGSRSWARHVLWALSPTAVWGVADATTKIEDVVAWARDLERFDAVALEGLTSSVSPASVLGSPLPVARLDDHPATPALWAAVVAERMMSERRVQRLSAC
ncbi:MAG: hypothetical protein ACYCS7_14080 [Acidimicrobiales bacterium]